jgi:CheY-like chemotaxis protein
VQDTGLGIAPADLEAIFEPFVQTPDGRGGREGTGLGLAISRQFARLMGGDLTVASAGVLGEGSLFRLEIPIGLADAADLPDARSSARQRAVGLQPGQPSYRLLVADDRAESRKLLADLLMQLGFAVRTAENGEQALRVWEEWQPHLIWMDMRMPVMDGHEATRRIKATAPGQGTAIIALTASVFEDERAAVLAEGCDDFVRKPFREAEIVDLLVKHLGVRMVYEAAAPASGAPAGPDAQLDFDVTGLRPEWVGQLQEAAVAADAEKIMRLADEVAGERPALADALRAWVDGYDYDAILGVVERDAQNVKRKT